MSAVGCKSGSIGLEMAMLIKGRWGWCAEPSPSIGCHGHSGWWNLGETCQRWWRTCGWEETMPNGIRYWCWGTR
jgi:hypothetical protein